MQIQINNLKKNYGKKTALDNVNLTIEQGMFGLLGPNGAGKTTLMKILTTLLMPTQGHVKICGTELTNKKEIRKLIGYLPQDFSMYSNMTAYEALDYLATLSGISRAARKLKVPELLEKVNLSDSSKVKVKAMSGGMKRRLGIAQALIHDPKVVIVDEPTAGLDPEERVRFRNLLSEIAQEKIVILSTHIVGDVEATCEKIAILNNGRISFNGTLNELLKEVEGKVYSLDVPSFDVKRLQDEYLVTGIIGSGGISTIKIVADEKPFEEAKLCKAGVEDAYLYLMRQEAAN